MGYTPSGAVLAKIAKNGSRDLIPGGLLGAKLAALGSQDGATDGQVGGTWDPKWDQHGKNNRSEDGSFLLMPLGLDFLGILIDFWYQKEGK